MIVFYNQPNILRLPYITIKKVQAKDKNGTPLIDIKTSEPKLIDKKVPEYFTFVPGKNTISKKLWLSIAECNSKNFEYYSSILRPFKPTVDKESQIEVGIDEEKIEIKKLKTREMIELIENTMDLNDLNEYSKNENNRDKPRRPVKEAIKTQIVLVNEAEAILEKD